MKMPVKPAKRMENYVTNKMLKTARRQVRERVKLLQKIDQREQKNIKQKTERDETKQESKDLCNDNARLQLEEEMARSSSILHLSRNALQKQRSQQNSSDVISRKMWMSRAERKTGFSERSTQLLIINRAPCRRRKSN